MLASLAPARRRLVLAVSSVLVLGVAAGVVALVVHTTSDAAPGPPAAHASPQRPGPVLLVPGYGGSTTSLDTLAALLRRDGKSVQVLSLPGDGEGDLDAQARALQSAALRLRAAGVQSVDVVGYSAGGVVARLWIRDHGGASIARRVITLGSPQHGTDLAGLAGELLPSQCPTACQQLEPGSSLLTALNAGDETPAGPSFVSIWTTHDNVVLPPSSAHLAGALNMTVQSVCRRDTVDHTGLPDDRTVEAMVVAELRAGAPVRLTPANCTTR
jgi:triacylglycerol esterase/lipase EstA (alpha/beta hydrolase family)